MTTYTARDIEVVRAELARQMGSTGTARIVRTGRHRHTHGVAIRRDADGTPYIRGRHRLQDAHPDTITVADLAVSLAVR